MVIFGDQVVTDVEELWSLFGLVNLSFPQHKYSRVPQTRNHIFGSSLLFSYNELLFYPCLV